MKLFIAILIYIFFINLSFAQTITGNIFEKNSKGEINYLIGVNIYWSETTIGTTSNDKGYFEIEKPQKFPSNLIFSYIGYKTDTILITDENPINIEMKSSVLLKEVEIIAREQSTKISTMTPINVETIGKKELLKAACCNLSESFETNASVDVNYTNAISGTKQIQMLGLDGIYTQILSENFPAIRGLSSGVGLSFIPGTWVESIQVTKGTGSVVNGYESIAGQINLEYLKPETSDKLFVNGYAGDFGRYEGNLHYAKKVNEKWSTLLFTHGSTIAKKNDNNKDGFLDAPLSTQYNVFNRWNYSNPNKFREGQLGVKILMEDKQGGQTKFDYKNDFGTKTNFGLGIKNKQFEVFTKTGFMFEEQPYKSVGIITNIKRNEQNSYFGLRKYNGEENSLYMNVIYQNIIKECNHKIKLGASYLLDNYKQSYNDSLFKRNESVPGIFTEYTYDYENKFSVVSGIRADYHNLYGLLINPRIHAKYNFQPQTVLRISGGRGLRVANIFVENSSILTSSRQVIVQENLLPEVAWNYGLTFTHKFDLFNREAVFNTDFFRTDFINQVVADYDKSVHQINFYNLKWQSFSNSFQAEFSFEPIKYFNIKTAYKWYDVRTTYSGELLSKPMLAKDRVFLNLGYITKYEKWKFDWTTKWFGKSRIPNTSSNPYQYRLNSYSDNYFILNSQVTRVFKKFELYLGCENLTDYKQPNAIIANNEPFSNYFDASLIWGPVMGRIIYGGFRFSIK